MSGKWAPPADPDAWTLALTAHAQWEQDRPKVVAYDTETTGLTYHDRAFGVSLAWVSDDVIQGREVYGYWIDLEAVDGGDQLVRMILEHADVVVGHNLKFDMHRAEVTGFFGPADWAAKEIHDTEAMAHLLDEHRDKGLKDLMVSVLGEQDIMMIPATKKDPEGGPRIEYEKPVPREKWNIEQAKLWAKKHYGIDKVADVGYHLLPRGTVVPYAIKDAVATFQLGAILHPQVLAHADLAELYAREMQLTRVLYRMERAGLRVRLDYVKQMVAKYRTKVLKHETKIGNLVGREVRTGKIPPKERDQYFNPASNPEVAAYFKAAGYPRAKYDAEQLRGIDHPLAATLLEYRGDKKLKESYLEALAKETGADGLYHQSSRQHGTVTGRLANGAERG